jgi:hypothetical protein
LVAQLHAPDLVNHVHGDHLESLLKFSAGQCLPILDLLRFSWSVWIGTNTCQIESLLHEARWRISGWVDWLGTGSRIWVFRCCQGVG